MKKYKSGFKVKKLYADTYAIIDNGIGQGPVYMYLLVGSEKAMLIDSGYGLLDLPGIIGTITDKEVICVCTHGHVDHALGACRFENAFLHSSDFDVYRQHTDKQLLTDISYKGIMKLPKNRLKNKSYLTLVDQFINTPHTPLKKLDNVKEFDLGDRIVSWKLVPGHTPGSIAIADKKYRTVFDGDSAPPGAWLFLDESASLEEYTAILENYLSFLSDQNVKKHFVGHSGASLSIKSIEKLLRCVKKARAHPSQGIKVSTLFGDARIIFAGGSLIFCGR